MRNIFVGLMVNQLCGMNIGELIEIFEGKNKKKAHEEVEYHYEVHMKQK